jgi:hypothetical protein
METAGKCVVELPSIPAAAAWLLARDSSRPVYLPLPCFEELQNVMLYLSMLYHNVSHRLAVSSSQ